MGAKIIRNYGQDKRDRAGNYISVIGGALTVPGSAVFMHRAVLHAILRSHSSLNQRRFALPG